MRGPRWLKVYSRRNSECGSAAMESLDFSQWWIDLSHGSLYLKFPRHRDQTVHAVHCRHMDRPRIGVRDGVLYWIIDATQEGPMSEPREWRPTVSEHSDGRGSTSRFPCGCVITRRGTNKRHNLCDEHSAELVRSWKRSMVATQEDAR